MSFPRRAEELKRGEVGEVLCMRELIAATKTIALHALALLAAGAVIASGNSDPSGNEQNPKDPSGTLGNGVSGTSGGGFGNVATNPSSANHSRLSRWMHLRERR